MMIAVYVMTIQQMTILHVLKIVQVIGVVAQ